MLMAMVVRRVDKETGYVESLDSMMARWKKAVKAEGTLELLQDRKYFKPKSIQRREKSLRAQIRDRKLNK